MRLELRATPEEVMRAVEAVQEFGRQKQLGEREIFGLALALEECGSNIVDHAYHRDCHQKFQVILEHTDRVITVELRDRGPAFDPTQERVARPAGDEESRAPGGWGIPLVRRYMDEIEYRYEAGENVLRLTKKLGQELSQPDSDTKTKHQ
jgi:anti-sigma regulatory factor (Ser/Thr protein kinase)